MRRKHIMGKKNKVIGLGVTISFIAIVLVSSGLLLAAGEKANLISVKATSPPKLDGSGNDAVWRDARELKVQAKDGPLISLKSVYTSDSLYMLVSWEDETKSVNKNMWVYDRTKWERLKELRTFEDKPRKADEDRLGLNWPINDSVKGFAEKGCLALCHDSGRFAKAESRMFTNSPTEFVDQWHWKAATGRPHGLTRSGMLMTSG
jgi:hypothetical protein